LQGVEEKHLSTNDDWTTLPKTTFDCGSDWFRDSHGTTGKRGGLVYLLSGGSISNLTTV
jgi:hypothetical protein